MILAGTAALLMLMFGGAADAASSGEGEQYAQVTVRQQVIVRMPARGRVDQSAAHVQWREARGPRCVQARAVVGATALGEGSVDLVLRDNSRVRARLDRGCPGLDFYQGFYVNGTEDGLICADRDSIRSRMGGQCEIDRFSTLTAVRP
jgi:hypothetical protein